MVRRAKKKVKHHFYENKKKISIKTLYSILVWMFAFVCILFVINIYFGTMEYVEENPIWIQEEMKLIFIDDNWDTHNIDQELLEHGADSKWDYLFDDKFIQQINSWNTWVDIKTNENIINTGKTQENVIKKDPITSTVNIIEEKKWCRTPRWKIMEHWESVLAYQQRSDTPDICNIQRRICNDWILLWNFQQKACKTNVAYYYKKEEVISYNEKKIDPLIQPWKDVPINKWEVFDIDWKINPSINPDTIWDNNINNPSNSEWNTVEQESMIRPNCISPRWEIILNWQFVKAYKYKNWFIDHPCEVQLRPCDNWNLEWLYTQQSCKHRDISFEDFMDGYFDKDQPSILRIIETLNKDIPENEVVIEKNSIWNMISNLWN